MFKKTKQTQLAPIDQQEISTLIGEGFVLTGDVSGPSVIRIDGKVMGNVKVAGGIILGEKGSIVGDIDTTSAIIYGSIKGNVKSKQLEIKRTGEISGDIKTETLEIEFGAQYNGKLEMKQLIKSEEKEAVS